MRRDSRADDRRGVAGTARTRAASCSNRERSGRRATSTTLDTPRRLAVLGRGYLRRLSRMSTEQINGPSVSVAYKDGQPTPAAHAFAKKAGVDVSQLETSHDSQGRIPLREGHEERAHRRRDSCRGAAQRNRLDLLAQEHVLAQAERALRASGALAGGHARWRGHPAGVRWNPGREAVARAPNSGRRLSHDSPRRRGLCRGAARRPKSSARERENSRFAKLSMPPRAPFPARAGAKTNRCSTRSST